MLSISKALTAIPFAFLLGFTPAVFADRAQPVRDISGASVDEDKLSQAIASRTLTWLTGSSSNNDYISVGRLANFFGFVGLRVSSGHSLSRSAVAKETLHVLNAGQRAHLIKLVEEQKDTFAAVHTARFNMNRALEGLRIDEPLTREDFLTLGEAYGMAEAELGRVIAESLGAVAVSLTPKQKTALQEIRSRYVSGTAGDKKIRGIKTKLPKADKKELVNIAARLLSWTTGTPEINDYEVVGKPSQHFGFVSLRLESNHGVKRGAVAGEVMALLTEPQLTAIDEAAVQNADVFDNFLAARGALMRTYETALNGKKPDLARVKTYGAQIGRLEAQMTWDQAQAMLKIKNTMTEAQLTDLLAMRAKYTGKSGGAAGAVTDPAERGRQLYAQCALCHNDSAKSAIAPKLAGIAGGKIAADTGFDNYSAALKSYAAAQTDWSDARLDAFLRAPRDAVPGTYMAYDGLKSANDRAAVIAYLKTRR